MPKYSLSLRRYSPIENILFFHLKFMLTKLVLAQLNKSEFLILFMATPCLSKKMNAMTSIMSNKIH